MDTLPTCLPINIFIVSPLGRFSTSAGCKCLCASKNIKNIFWVSHKNTLICLVGVTLPATPAVRKQKSIAFSTQKSAHYIHFKNNFLAQLVYLAELEEIDKLAH